MNCLLEHSYPLQTHVPAVVDPHWIVLSIWLGSAKPKVNFSLGQQSQASSKSEATSRALYVQIMSNYLVLIASFVFLFLYYSMQHK